ncbi:class II SORL domain-containing protein [Wansuia hejianensis]|uniref:Class II SORL domain-containing protein n=1 Tax=Wansuia hejianensis TaxID=2763667 RepID=A0A926EYB6_9FIRM|nr:class II SORL domain-containing protein [Wansuia hejianensis]MBC8591221.1 class II SORL domain-containing protein [Wansuia hejianensis]
MKSIGTLYQSGDWKGEKHVPVIHAPETVKSGEPIEVKVIIGEEIPHPNTLEHYIGWVKVYFFAEDAKFPVEIGNYDFSAHGENGLFTEPNITTRFTTEKSGTIFATSYCNIHGLWENSVELKVE